MVARDGRLERRYRRNESPPHELSRHADRGAQLLGAGIREAVARTGISCG
ncbi:hypothetical protein MA5S0422_3092 [Mycobacteroides abscessus 5S-0422]|uniref:Uncharacterized protein n=1 Tax=Mycobacteroides abscessus subsp. bolletii 1513 TaxID=1299321 RepID=X8DQL0_9MYCO|nr:hypothetical protein MA5S0421_2413 [Mycobacteroides abscessus 5S-0421]EIU11279.1 hypothetical protein MA5S0304_2159 [Mycobacteroides abscessus 5S-0304]EIU14040.1 hypothetical protein MA5S0422_3092 [Mycobacteroides abscessus 5S-0422]EIU20797.1 hypothetical protein MA5S0708_5181 [Mycobacteroides abscessus 5S-0708]EIU26559.1 hypothetical protein MA5S0817_1705 [Mycobacteroides abscessus 5S-0817]EIU31543.1 hypothetical protein MA5S1212_1844 [Mycobacteroides abscessus 5S-1212]EIU45576.1 hypothet